MQVNRCIEDKSFDRIDHALGRPVDPLSETYRNHFAISDDSQLCAEFDASPNWQRYGGIGDMLYFRVTTSGRQALAHHLRAIGDTTRMYDVTFDGITMTVPAKSRGAARYAGFLRASDCIHELTFGDFCRRSSVLTPQCISRSRPIELEEGR